MLKFLAMLNNLESAIHQIIINSSAVMAKEIATAVRQALAAEIIGSDTAVAAPAKRRPGRPRGARTPAPAASAPAAVSAPKVAKRAKLKKRSSKQVARDDAAILDVVKEHAGLRSLELQKKLEFPSQNIASGLRRLRTAGKIKMKGAKSSARYTAA